MSKGKKNGVTAMIIIFNIIYHVLGNFYKLICMKTIEMYYYYPIINIRQATKGIYLS